MSSWLSSRSVCNLAFSLCPFLRSGRSGHRLLDRIRSCRSARELIRGIQGVPCTRSTASIIAGYLNSVSLAAPPASISTMHHPKKNCPFHGSSFPCRRDCVSPSGNHCTLDFTNPVVNGSTVAAEKKTASVDASPAKCPFSHMFEKVEDEEKVTLSLVEEQRKKGKSGLLLRDIKEKDFYNNKFYCMLI